MPTFVKVELCFTEEDFDSLSFEKKSEIITKMFLDSGWQIEAARVEIDTVDDIFGF